MNQPKDLLDIFGNPDSPEKAFIEPVLNYAKQYTSRQIRAITRIEQLALRFEQLGFKDASDYLKHSIQTFERLKPYHNTAPFIHAVVTDYSMRKYLEGHGIGVNVQKQ